MAADCKAAVRGLFSPGFIQETRQTGVCLLMIQQALPGRGLMNCDAQPRPAIIAFSITAINSRLHSHLCGDQTQHEAG